MLGIHFWALIQECILSERHIQTYWLHFLFLYVHIQAQFSSYASASQYWEPDFNEAVAHRAAGPEEAQTKGET